MDFGSHLDDELFDHSFKIVNNAPIPYDAKIHHPEWFIGSCPKAELKEDLIKRLKHKADYYYHKRKYNESSHNYETVINQLPANSVVQKECLENIVRCYMLNQQFEEALNKALLLHSYSANVDQKIVSSNLLAQVYHGIHKFEDELKLLQFCIHHHQQNTDFWLRLSYCYANCFALNLPSICSIFSSNNGSVSVDLDIYCICPEIHYFTEQCCCNLCKCSEIRGEADMKKSIGRGRNIVGACLVKARALAAGSQMDTDSFVDKRNKRAYEHITALISILNFSSDYLNFASPHMCKEESFLETGYSQEENKESFEEKWFGFLN